MAKAGPKSQGPQDGPFWKQSRPLALVSGGIAGLIAMIVGVQQFFFSGNPERLSPGLDQVVDRFLESERAQSPAERHQDVEKRIRHLLGLREAPGFDKLARAQKDAVMNRLQELREYEDYAAELKKVDDPRTARSDAQLRAIHDSLTALRVPAAYLTEWPGTPAHDQHTEWRTDAESLQKSVKTLSGDYQQLTKDAQRVLDTAGDANLPQRARSVLARANDVQSVEKRQAEPIPGSRRVTFATVLQFPSVAEARQRWLKVRKTLEDLAGLGKP